MKTLKVSIKGTTPLLMNRFPIEEHLSGKKSRKLHEDLTPQEKCERSLYGKVGRGKWTFPITSLRSAMKKAGANFKLGRKYASSLVAAAVMLDEEELVIESPKWEVDARAGVNPHMRGARVVIFRPRFEKWKAKFTILLDEELLPEDTLRSVFEYAGRVVGIGGFRPERGGIFGKFKVVSWK